MGELVGLILVLVFIGFLAFIALAPKELRQAALGGMWALMALATVGSVIVGILK